MTFIRPINVNTQGIGGASGFSPKTKAEEKEHKEPEITSGSSEKAPISGEKVLEFMAQSASTVKPKTIDTTKYVDEESAARIAGFMSDFEDKVADGLKAFNEEFEGMNVSDSTKMTLVLAKLNEEA